MTRLQPTDGLRGIAVISVVLFHTFPALVRGGFIGVDIFFVISGFIIYLIYFCGLADHSITFTSFFTRRVRRLAPAYIAAVSLTTVLAILLMNPRDLTNYGFALAAQAVYGQNIVFWSIGDYFESPLTKPLLHTWSLAVEEQFYLAFPLLVLFKRYRPRLVISVSILLGALSIGAGLYVGCLSPKTSFYWLPFRVWEFVAGMIAAIIYRKTIIPSLISRALFDAALLVVLISIIAFNSTSGFPGWQSFMAVAGSAVLLACQRARCIGSDLLGLAVVQWAGRISYSWYLWHWPPLALWFIVTGSAATGQNAIGLLIIGLGAGVVSYLWLERRLTARFSLLRPKHAAGIAICFATAAFTISYIVASTNGLLSRYPPKTAALLAAQMDVPSYRCPFIKRAIMWREEICELNAFRQSGGILLVGDSHADRTKTILLQLADERMMPLFLTKRNCRLTDYDERLDCSLTALKESIKRTHVQAIIAIAHWNTDPDTLERIRFDHILGALGVPVYIQLPTPEGPAVDPETALQNRGLRPVEKLSTSDGLRQGINFRNFVIEEAVRHKYVHFIDPIPLLCPRLCITSSGGHQLYRDSNHLTLAGVDLLKPLYLPIFVIYTQKTSKIGNRI